MDSILENIELILLEKTTMFVTESNRIEGITRPPTKAEIDEHRRFVDLDLVTVEQLERFVSVYQPDAKLRDRPGLNVRVGDHFPPQGSAAMGSMLRDILADIETQTPYETHVRYETLHPFTDGNGRSGRVLWAWQMMRRFNQYSVRFLHQFYYQALSGARPIK